MIKDELNIQFFRIRFLKPIEASFIHGISWVRIESNPQTQISNFTSFGANP